MHLVHLSQEGKICTNLSLFCLIMTPYKSFWLIRWEKWEKNKLRGKQREKERRKVLKKKVARTERKGLIKKTEGEKKWCGKENTEERSTELTLSKLIFNSGFAQDLKPFSLHGTGSKLIIFVLFSHYNYNMRQHSQVVVSSEFYC